VIISHRSTGHPLLNCGRTDTSASQPVAPTSQYRRTGRSQSTPGARRDPAPDLAPSTGHRLTSTSGRPCDMAMAGSPRSGTLIRLGRRIECQITLRPSQIHGLPTHSAPAPGCSAPLPFPDLTNAISSNTPILHSASARMALAIRVI